MSHDKVDIFYAPAPNFEKVGRAYCFCPERHPNRWYKPVSPSDLKSKHQAMGKCCSEFNTSICFIQYLNLYIQTLSENLVLFYSREAA